MGKILPSQTLRVAMKTSANPNRRKCRRITTLVIRGILWGSRRMIKGGFGTEVGVVLRCSPMRTLQLRAIKMDVLLLMTVRMLGLGVLMLRSKLLLLLVKCQTRSNGRMRRE